MYNKQANITQQCKHIISQNTYAGPIVMANIGRNLHWSYASKRKKFALLKWKNK